LVLGNVIYFVQRYLQVLCCFDFESVMDFWCENVNKLHNPIETPPCCFEGRGKWLSASGVRLSLPLPPHNIGPMKGEGIK
jgi:hypothetical protein